MHRVLPLLLVSALATACHTPCQSLCIQMADYAEECGLTLSDAELNSCLEQQASDQDQGACRRVGSADTLRSEWTCEDVEVFFR